MSRLLSAAMLVLATLEGLHSRENYIITKEKLETLNENTRGRIEQYERSPTYVHGCHGDSLYLDVLLTTNTTLQTPNFPTEEKSFQRPMSCIWVLRSLVSSRRVVVRVDESKLDEQPDDYNCSRAYGAVYDGDSNQSPMIGKFCGPESVQYTSTGSRLTVTFVTDGSANNTGFAFRYFLSPETEDGVYDPKYPTYECKSISEVLKKRPIRIVSPNFPEKPLYNGPNRCFYIIEAEMGYSKIIFDAQRFELEFDCTRNYMEVYNISGLAMGGQYKALPNITTARHLDRFCFKDLDERIRTFDAQRLLVVCSALDVGRARGFVILVEVDRGEIEQDPSSSIIQMALFALIPVVVGGMLATILRDNLVSKSSGR